MATTRATELHQQSIELRLSLLFGNHADLCQHVADFTKSAPKDEIAAALNMGLMKKVLRTTPEFMAYKVQMKERYKAVFAATTVAWGEERGKLICKHAELFAEMGVEQLKTYAERVAEMEEPKSDGDGDAASADSQ
ncbi:hypothetical protein LTR37_019454 [Vermiconidia calcicola]|uniref:Uncharacterized protein n=1 Tax=Vermiconidia calcicola TaxID=1690605 RepID=A0ACC3MEC4_9PEZI|nr:hypothetical protein LTR37_019454 [Vermiconidia calcicola]